MREFTHLSLFTGIGGLDLAAEWAGFTTVGQCEFADYPTKVLEKNWPDVPRWRDVQTMTKESFYERTGLRTVDVISGGFPCQPFSVAGKQKGKEDARYLWPEMLRVITELRPHFVVGENVPGIIKIAAGQVVKNLERAGYHVVVFNFEAAAVGAWHRRSRVFFAGIAENVENAGCGGQRESENVCKQPRRTEFIGTGKTLSGPESERQQRERTCGEQISRTRFNEKQPERRSDVYNAVRGRCTGVARREKSQELADGRCWAAEPDVGRVAHGIPYRVDRLKCLGNAVVPQQAYPIFRALREEMEEETL